MKILINFSTLKTGGGQNVGLNFITSLNKSEYAIKNCHFVIAKKSDIHFYFISNGLTNFTIMPHNPITRMIKELIIGRRIISKYNINIVYTYFGIGLYPKSIPQITGSADSNLFFPEIDFWRGYKGFSLIKRKLVDKYRIWGLKRASGIIFENFIMQKRFHELYDFTKLTTFIKPSLVKDYQNKKFVFPKSVPVNITKGLFLCGWHLNKNIMIIPELASKLKKMIDFHFILTAPIDESYIHKEFKRLVDKFDVKDQITITGVVKKDELASLYDQIDFVFLLSKLESFSNNIIESWSFKKLLVISDEFWARSICKDAALYVKRNSIDDISEKILKIIGDDVTKKKIIENGINELRTYPSIEQKTKLELQFIKYVYKNI